MTKKKPLRGSVDEFSRFNIPSLHGKTITIQPLNCALCLTNCFVVYLKNDMLNLQIHQYRFKIIIHYTI